MTKNSLLAALILIGAQVQAARPMSEMEGGCDNFAMSLSKEMALWDKAELRVQGAQDDKSTAVLPTDRKVNLTLYPVKKVTLPVKPEKDFAAKNEVTYAGLAAIDVKKDGVYRISLGSKVWLDLVEESGGETPPNIVKAQNFEMQTGCPKIFKAVEYRLRAGNKYFLQISSSKESRTQLLTSFVN